MSIPYSLDLRWRIIWIALAWHSSPQHIGQQLSVSERTVRRYLKMFEETGDVKPRLRRSGPLRLFGEYEQLTLLRLILEQQLFGVDVSVSIICRTLNLVARKYSI